MSDENDIPKRLREQSVGDYSVSLWDEAADEIDRLRAEVAALKAVVSRISLRWEIADHRVSLLWVERDEARREYCEAQYREERADLRSTPTSPEVIAANRGWDCFDAKEAKP